MWVCLLSLSYFVLHKQIFLCGTALVNNWFNHFTILFLSLGWGSSGVTCLFECVSVSSCTRGFHDLFRFVCVCFASLGSHCLFCVLSIIVGRAARVDAILDAVLPVIGWWQLLSKLVLRYWCDGDLSILVLVAVTRHSGASFLVYICTFNVCSLPIDNH